MVLLYDKHQAVSKMMLPTCLIFFVLGTLTISHTDIVKPVQGLEVNASNNPLECLEEENERLGDDCLILKVFDEHKIESDWTFEQTLEIARYCACKLLSLPWEQAFGDYQRWHNVYQMVSGVLSEDRYKETHPVYLWSDVEVTMGGVSIYTATRDYFEKKQLNSSLGTFTRQEIDKNETLKIIRHVCVLVARDRLHMYQYMENLIRINPVVFLKLIDMEEYINMIYQASKACKLFIWNQLEHFNLWPKRRDYVPVEGYQNRKDLTITQRMDSLNTIYNDDIDSALRSSSIWLKNCQLWQKKGKQSISQLIQDCPMMISDELPLEWVNSHPTSEDRTQMALKCGCQLLLHNSTWDVLMRDEKITIMSKALTTYLNHNKIPNFQNQPLWSIHGWFSNVMQRFATNKKNTVKEIVKYLHNDQDPKVAINPKTSDEDNALELVRRACNFIMFNYNKGSDQVSELKLIKYLDNLSYISPDPLFVFHLTLQNANLFKLHALSKMCEPVVR